LARHLAEYDQIPGRRAIAPAPEKEASEELIGNDSDAHAGL